MTFQPIHAADFADTAKSIMQECKRKSIDLADLSAISIADFNAKICQCNT